MPLSIDRTTEAAISTLFDTDFFNRLKKYLGLHPNTPSEDLPVDVEDLFSQAVSTCETEQWRFILPKEVTLQLPIEAFKECDKMLFLPFGKADEVTMTYTDLNEDVQDYTDFEILVGEPLRLYSSDWSALINGAFEHPYPVNVTYTPGYTALNEIPKSTIRALMILTYHYFEFRDSLGQGKSFMPVPQGYEHNMSHARLNDYRAIRYVVDDWNKVSPS